MLSLLGEHMYVYVIAIWFKVSKI